MDCMISVQKINTILFLSYYAVHVVSVFICWFISFIFLSCHLYSFRNTTCHSPPNNLRGKIGGVAAGDDLSNGMDLFFSGENLVGSICEAGSGVRAAGQDVKETNVGCCCGSKNCFRITFLWDVCFISGKQMAKRCKSLRPVGRGDEKVWFSLKRSVEKTNVMTFQNFMMLLFIEMLIPDDFYHFARGPEMSEKGW